MTALQLGLFDAAPTAEPIDMRRITFVQSLGGLEVRLDGRRVPGWLCGTVRPEPVLLPGGCLDCSRPSLAPYRVSRCCWSPRTYATKELAALALLERNRYLRELRPDLEPHEMGRYCIPWEPWPGDRCPECGGPKVEWLP